MQKSLVAKLDWRNIDGNLDIIRPAGCFRAGFHQDPVADLADQSGFLGDRDEVRRGDVTACGMFPANERFATNDALCLDVNEWLIMQLELPFEDRGAQVHFERMARLELQVHFTFEEAECPLSVELGAIKRDIRLFQKFV